MFSTSFLVLQPAQMNRRDAQIRGNHVLRNSRDDTRENLFNGIVSLFWRQGIGTLDTIIMETKIQLSQQPAQLLTLTHVLITPIHSSTG